MPMPTELTGREAEVVGRVGPDHPLMVSLRRHREAAFYAHPAQLAYPMAEIRARAGGLTEEQLAELEELRAERDRQDRGTFAHYVRARRLARTLEVLAERYVSAETAALVLALLEPEPEELPAARIEAPPPRTCLRPAPLSTRHASTAPPRARCRSLDRAKPHGAASQPPPE